jgi:hypothetical protein
LSNPPDPCPVNTKRTGLKLGELLDLGLASPGEHSEDVEADLEEAVSIAVCSFVVAVL